MKSQKKIKLEAKNILKADFWNITIKMAAVLLTSLLINNIGRYGFIFLKIFLPLIIYIVIKTSFYCL